MCDECAYNYKLDDTLKTCSRQSLFLSQYILELLVLSFVAIFVLLGPYMGSVGHYQQYHQTAVLDSRDIGIRRVNEHRAHWVKGIPSSRQSIIYLRITHSSCSPIHSVDARSIQFNETLQLSGDPALKLNRYFMRYTGCQIKRHHLSLLLLTIECVCKIQ